MNRYNKNIKVIGSVGQSRLSHASVLIIGCGALGGQIAMLLAGSGVGKIGIADFDTVDITNLQRQLFFSEANTGLPKVRLIAERMRQLNSEIDVREYAEMIRRDNSEQIFPEYDLIVDATDNPATKYFTDRYSQKYGKPCCIGGVASWRGQVVILATDSETRYPDIFPMPENDSSMLPCEIEGVMGPSASLISSLQAAEIIKWLSSDTESNKSKMIVADLETPTFSVFLL